MKVFVGLLLFVSCALVVVAQKDIAWYKCNLYTKEWPNRYGPQNDVGVQATRDRVNKIIQNIRRHPFGVVPEEDVFANHINSLDQSINEMEFPTKCALIDVPLWYDDEEDTRTIPIYVKKLGSDDAKHALWILQGGPGGDSSPMEMLMRISYIKLGTDWAIYTLDHRGVGRSSRLGCTGPQAETPASDGGTDIVRSELDECKDYFVNTYGKDTSAYSLEFAARDLGYLMNKTALKAKDNLYLYGVSYGTMWGNRYMQLYPGQSRSVILDGVVCTSGPRGVRLDFAQWDRSMNKVGYDYMEKCREDSFCSAKMGIDAQTDMKQYVKSIFEKVKNPNLCSGVNMTVTDLRNVLGDFLLSLSTRPMITPLLYRFKRCSSSDVEVLNFFADAARAMRTIPQCKPLSSSILQDNVAASELWEYGDDVPTESDLEEIDKDLEFSDDSAPKSAYAMSIWPQYPRSPWFNTTADVPKIDLLLLNGDLDAQTPKYSAINQAKRIHGKNGGYNDVFRLVGNTVHGTAFVSPVKDPNALPCGTQIMLSFLKNSSFINDTCLSDVAPVDFKGEKASNLAFFGTEDAYDGVISHSSGGGGSSNKDTVSAGLFAALVSILSVICVFLFVGIILTYRMYKKAKLGDADEKVPLFDD